MTQNTSLDLPGGRLRLYVDSPLGAGQIITPDSDQTHYLLHVMRAKQGQTVNLFNGRDGEWLARISEQGKRHIHLTCLQQSAPQQNAPDLWLLFAPIKKTPSDYLAQKATELGVSKLQPVITRRTIVSRVNLDRLRANAMEAAEQSGRTDIPEIAESQTLEKSLAHWPADRAILFCDEAGDAAPITTAVQNTGFARWAILIGPEGGFDPQERSFIRAIPQAIPVTLGQRILRADTAALAALAIWQSVLGA